VISLVGGQGEPDDDPDASDPEGDGDGEDPPPLPPLGNGGNGEPPPDPTVTPTPTPTPPPPPLPINTPTPTPTPAPDTPVTDLLAPIEEAVQAAQAVLGLVRRRAVAGESVILEPVGAGAVIRLPGADRFEPLSELRVVPIGTLVDPRRARVRLTSAADASGTEQTATFYGGAFRIHEDDSAAPVTELRLAGGSFAACASRHRASRPAARAARHGRKRARRRLWGDGEGRFRTRGRYGTAAVRGTLWLTEDFCTYTKVRVARGMVEVDGPRIRPRTIRAPRSAILRPRSSRARGGR
jgi:hypothetical protein